MPASLITPDWPAPAHIKAVSSTRLGGVSQSPYDSLNLGLHVDDNPDAVAANRNILSQSANLPSSPMWLNQVHGTDVVDACQWEEDMDADASYSNQPGKVCVVMTADCLPVLFTDRQGTQVAAAHAGWRGLLAGVLEDTLGRFSGKREDILAWLGPAIGPAEFEVGTEVFDAFNSRDKNASEAFRQTDSEHYLADIYLLAKQRLVLAGVTEVFGGEYCTVSDPARFFSYRRDGITGRMASLIWIDTK